MNVNPLIINALCDLNIPVEFITATEKSESFIVFSTLGETADMFADDCQTSEITTVTVDIYSLKNYKNLLKDVKNKLRNAGFIVSVGPEQFEKETGYFHVSVDCKILSETEE